MLPAQLATLKAAIDADPTLSAFPMNTDGYIDLANKLNNEVASPDFWVWKERVTLEEIQNNGFAWVEVDSITAGKARIWEWMFEATGATDPSKQNVRAGIEECWKGTAGRLAVQAEVFTHCRKLATLIARIFAVAASAPPTPSGNLGSATNVAMAVVVGVTASEVEQARSLP